MTSPEPRPLSFETSHPLTGQLRSALEGAVYPLTVEEAVWVARENECPRTLVSLLHGLRANEIGSLEEAEELVEQSLLADTPR